MERPLHRALPIVVFAALLGCSRTHPAGRESTTTPEPTSSRPELIDVIEAMGTRAPLVIAADLAVDHSELCFDVPGGRPSWLEGWCKARHGRDALEYELAKLVGVTGDISLEGLDERGWFAAALFEPLGVEIVADAARPLGIAIRNAGARNELSLPAAEPDALVASLERIGRKYGRAVPYCIPEQASGPAFVVPSGMCMQIAAAPSSIRVAFFAGATTPYGTESSIASSLETPVPRELPRTAAYQALARGAGASAALHWRPWLLSDLHATLGIGPHGSSSWATEAAILIARSVGAAAVFPASGAELDDHAVLLASGRRGLHALHVASTTPRGERAFGLLATETAPLQIAEGSSPITATLHADLRRAHELLPHPMLIAGNEDLLQELDDQRGVALTYLLAHTPIATLRTLLGNTSKPLQITSVQVAAMLGGPMSAAVRGDTREDIQAILEPFERWGPLQVEFIEHGASVTGLIGRGASPREVFELVDASTPGLLAARVKLPDGPTAEVYGEYRVVPGAVVGHWYAGASRPDATDDWSVDDAQPRKTPFRTESPGEQCLRAAADILLDGFARLRTVEKDAVKKLVWDATERAMPSVVCAQRDPRTVQRARNLMRLLVLPHASTPEPAVRFCRLTEDPEICARAEGKR